MNWVNTMASNAADAANNPVPRDDTTRGNVMPGSWDPHQVWLTRVKQPRDDRSPPSNPSAARLPAQSAQSAQSRFWTRATR